MTIFDLRDHSMHPTRLRNHSFSLTILLCDDVGDLITSELRFLLLLNQVAASAAASAEEVAEEAALKIVLLAQL